MKKIYFSIKNITTIGLLLGFILISTNTPSTKAATATSEAFAPSSYTVLAPLPCIESPATDNNPGVTCEGGNGSLQKQLDFKTYVQYTINLLIGLSAVVAVVMMVWGGIEYMYNASFQGKKDGLERAKNAVIGFVLILTSYIIMRTIDPRLVEIPNSLVPQITLNEYLAQDANQLLMNQVQSDIDKSKIQIAEYYDKMQKASKSVADKQKEIDDIKKQIEDIKSNPAGLEAVGAEQKIRELQIKQAKSEEELAALQVTSTVATVKQRVNLVLSVAQNNFQVGTDVIVKNSKDLIKQINDSETQIGMIKAQGTGALTKAGNGEYWKVTEQTDYGYAILDSYKINLMINSIQYVPRTASRSSILITDSNGNNKEFYTDPKGKTDIQQANDFIQNEIQNLTKTQGSITDEELKSNFQKRIVDVTNKLNGNPILNPAKK